MKQLVVLADAPGVGKSTVSRLVRARLGCPYVELGYLRMGHLLRSDWSDESEKEMSMAFENLAFIVRNYLRHGYQTVLALDLTEALVQRVPLEFADLEYLIATLVVTDDTVMRNRVLDPGRDSGFRNVDAALAWNRCRRESALLPHEHRIDNTASDPRQAVDRIVGLITGNGDEQGT